MEYILSLLKWIVDKIQDVEISEINELIYHVDSLRHNQNTQFWSKISEFLKSNDVKTVKVINTVLPIGEIMADWFQNSLDFDTRKEFASNYTMVTAIELFNSFLPKSIPKNIIDPFSGSGRLILGILDNLEKGVEYPKITINEYLPFACILAYYNIMANFLKAEEPLDKITVFLGDAFTNLTKSQKEKFDLIVMNPPFTRVHRIKSKTKKALELIKHAYPGLITGQPGLHYYALLLADQILKDQGTIVSILPGSTFASVYSKPLMEFYLDNYRVEKIIKLTESSAFSDNSNLKEIIFVTNKIKISFENETSFEVMDFQTGTNFTLVNQISSQQLKENWNWLKYFESMEMLQLESLFLQNPIIQSGETLKVNILRGLEMYGPDFFCFPNSDWSIEAVNEKAVVVKQLKNGTELSIPRIFLIQSLRKSGLYKNQINPQVNEYILSVPKNERIDRNIGLYSELNTLNSAVARKKFGKDWIHHTSDQNNAKQAYGNLFFVDKLSLDTSGIICHYSEERYSATKNFYIMKGDVDELNLQAAWLNSSCFIVLYLINRREIGPKLGRMQIIDLMKTRLFIDTKQLSPESRTSIIDQFHFFKSKSLPRIPDQIGKDYRRELDKAVLLGLGIAEKNVPTILNNIYESLIAKLVKS